MARLWIGVVVVLVAMPAAGQQSASTKPSKLVAGKLAHVEPMPANLDQWILEYLRRWGKYRVTGDPEGVDLIVRANAPERQTQYKTRAGVPQPRETKDPVVLSLTVIDWVTSEILWHADLLDRKPKKDEPEPPVGPQTRIFVRGLTADQIADKFTAKLREYVNELEKAGSRKQ